jgi:protein-S-isoprenylcysteine O-methyltransferase Ste14
VLWIGPEIIGWVVKRSPDASKARDRGSLGLIAVLWWIGIAADILFSLFVPQAATRWERPLLFFFGIGSMLAGIGLRWDSVQILGQYFTFDVAIHGGQSLIESGPYRFVRHPSYTGALLTLFGFGLALGNWAGLVAALACLGVAYAYRIPVEESALTGALGDTYVQYMKRTWRLVPFVF